MRDGYVVDRNGNGYYPGNNGQQVSCNDGSCVIANQQGYNGNYGSNNGNWNSGRYTNYDSPNDGYYRTNRHQ